MPLKHILALPTWCQKCIVSELQLEDISKGGGSAHLHHVIKVLQILQKKCAFAFICYFEVHTSINGFIKHLIQQLLAWYFTAYHQKLHLSQTTNLNKKLGNADEAKNLYLCWTGHLATSSNSEKIAFTCNGIQNPTQGTRRAISELAQ